MTLDEQPDVLDINWIPATAANAPAGTTAARHEATAPYASMGRPIIMTNVNRYTDLGGGCTHNEAIAKQVAFFLGHKWDLSDRWNVDWGLRSENYGVKGVQRSSVRNDRVYDPTCGGADWETSSATRERRRPTASRCTTRIQSSTSSRRMAWSLRVTGRSASASA